MQDENDSALLGGSEAPLAVAGSGLVCAAGDGMDALFDALDAGRSCIAPLERIRGRSFQCDRGGEAPPSWREADRRAAAISIVALDEALGDACVPDAATDRTGLVVATALGDAERTERFAAGDRDASSIDEARRLGAGQLAADIAAGIASGSVSTQPSVFSATCVSGLCALEQAAADLALRRADRVAIVAFDELSASMQAGFSALRALSPTGELRPFDVAHDGIVLGEAACAVVLEPLRRLRARGREAAACVLASRLFSDAYHMTGPDPSGDGMATAIRRVLDDAGLAAADIGCVTVTATGSAVYDRMLSRAVETALGAETAAALPVTTWEPATGHALAATGALAIAHAARLVATGRVHPVFGVESVDPECRLDYVLDAPRELRRPVVLALIVGFGGQNGALLVGRPPAGPSRPSAAVGANDAEGVR